MRFRIVWSAPCGAGQLSLRGGEFVGPLEIPSDAVEFVAEVRGENVSPGDCPTLVRVLRGKWPFTFFLRDIVNASPLWYPLAGCAVTRADDLRSYGEIVSGIKAQGLQTDAERMCSEPEEFYDAACCRSVKDQDVPVWLGVARDARFFRVNRHIYENLGSWGEITIWNHSVAREYPDSSGGMRLIFEVGPGSHGCHYVTRRLHEGTLPILHVTQNEQTIDYEMTFFATRESRPLSARDVSVGGSDPIAAYAGMCGANIRPEEKAALGAPAGQLSLGDEEDAMVLWLHVEAVNRTPVPAYAFFRVPHLARENRQLENGLLHYGDEGGVICASTLDGKPTPQREMAVLVPGNGRVKCDWRIFHSLVPATRAAAMLESSYEEHLAGAVEYWHAMAAQGARIAVPETGIQERIDAGILHLELNTLGRADGDGPLLAAAGVYAPIGTESSPIIQYMDSMGRHKTAARSIQWFLDRQDENGYINSYADYESETGPVLWCVAEHYRLTRDRAWLLKVLPQVEKSARFLLAQREEAKKTSGGLVAGKSSDPEDKTPAFFLNAGVYLGIAGLAEALEDVDPDFAKVLAAEAAGYSRDIRRGLEQSAMESPLTPLLDGSWTPALGPWPGINGNVAYHADGGEWFSHGTIMGRLDSGSMALFLSDALPAEDPLMELVLKSHQHPQFHENAGLSQPYYFRHDIAHLKRGETKLFLKCFYNQLVSMQDRQSYTFWEHYFEVSSHKTHEEGWFLMQCRWMLALEEQDGITFLKGIPRKWLEPGKEIRLENLATYYGKANLVVRSREDGIDGHVTLERSADNVRIRVPHWAGMRPSHVKGGIYDPDTETLAATTAEFHLEF